MNFLRKLGFIFTLLRSGMSIAEITDFLNEAMDLERSGKPIMCGRKGKS
jgi:hypothetical protein